MKPILITDDNIKAVYGRVKKFFFNKNRTGFDNWHNFDCGFKKHISPYIWIGVETKELINCKRKYPTPTSVRFIDNEMEKWIVVDLMPGHAFAIQTGDKIAFRGNHFILRTKWILREHEYVYDVFQANDMTSEEKSRMIQCAELEHAAYEEDYYRMYEIENNIYDDLDYSYDREEDELYYDEEIFEEDEMYDI